MIIILSSASYIIQHIIKSAREKILFHECIDQVSMQHRRMEASGWETQKKLRGGCRSICNLFQKLLRDVEEEEI